MIDETILARARHIRLLALDSDGVLTDGGVYMFEDGTEFRRFDIKDGLGLRRVMRAGLEVAIISASVIKAVERRAEKLRIREVHLGITDKRAVLADICQRLGITFEQVAYVGDDLTDLAVLPLVGLACAPADAVPQVRAAVQVVTARPGGYGAVREVCDLLVPPETTKGE